MSRSDATSSLPLSSDGAPQFSSVSGGRPATIWDVAQRAGISKSTVSRALAGEAKVSPSAREAALKAARELGFEPNPNAQRLVRGESNPTIGLFSPDLDLGVGTRKMQAIQHLLGSKGYVVPVHAYGYRESGVLLKPEELLRGLLRDCPRAVVCNTGNAPGEAMQQELLRYRASGGVAVCYDWQPLDGADSVVFDREDNSYQAVRHLLDLGHREIGFYCARGPLSPRWRGAMRAFEEAGLTLRPEWSFVPKHYIEFEEGAIELAAQFLALQSRPTAMCIVNDHAAAAFCSEVMRAGVRVPEELSVIGHDDACIARCAPVPLSTVSHPIAPLAGAVVEMLESRLRGDYTGAPRTQILRGELVVRQSTAPPQNQSPENRSQAIFS